MKTLFLSYGTGPHQLEVQYAVRCLSVQSPAASADVLVYTDTPATFNGLPATIVHITSSQWTDWGGPQNFNHRRKILALDHALAATDQPVLLLDGDTWLRRPLSLLRDRIGPGCGVMHIREGQISAVRSPLYGQLRQLLTSENGRQSGIPVAAWMWNAGVIGLHPQQLPLLQEVLRLTDLLCRNSSLHILEQLAFSWVLSQRIDLREAADVVFHYWPPYLHKPFRNRLPAIMAEAASLPPAQQVRFLYAQRPRPGLVRRGKVICKRLLEAVGLLRGYCRSNEW
jgi:hypothetical protein